MPIIPMSSDFEVRDILAAASNPFCVNKSAHSLNFVVHQEKMWYTRMSSALWRMYADHLFYRWEKNVVWEMVEPYRRPKSFTPVLSIYVAAFYTGVIGAAVTEQLYKEKYWEDHPGEAPPLMKPKFYYGPWNVRKDRRPNE
eukprot:TRINITY_DN4335_c0_g1_i3.p1 TRINITY_DN4335_c0_g1~~TRINITY_DN4335_c0_g1_i3.p1  ORF type:complete len:141 (+),score=24.08 TRINITY_DN4335_c0_g1_i3:339-761(+)